MQEVQLLVDEICEAGAVLEKESSVLLSRIRMQDDHMPAGQDGNAGGPNVADFLDKAKEAMRKTIPHLRVMAAEEMEMTGIEAASGLNHYPGQLLLLFIHQQEPDMALM